MGGHYAPAFCDPDDPEYGLGLNCQWFWKNIVGEIAESLRNNELMLHLFDTIELDSESMDSTTNEPVTTEMKTTITSEEELMITTKFLPNHCKKLSIFSA